MRPGRPGFCRRHQQHAREFAKGTNRQFSSIRAEHCSNTLRVQQYHNIIIIDNSLAIIDLRFVGILYRGRCSEFLVYRPECQKVLDRRSNNSLHSPLTIGFVPNEVYCYSEKLD